MEALLISLVGLLVTIGTFYAKEADTLSDKSLRFTKAMALIVAIATIILGLGLLTTIVIGLIV